MTKTVGRRDFLRLTGVGLVSVAAAACGGEPEVVEKVVKETVEVEKVVKETVEVEKEVTRIVEEGEEGEEGEEPVATGKYAERPEFARMVENGELPPVDERLPSNPQVMEGDEIGSYGGEFLCVENPFSHAWEIYAFIVNNDVTDYSPEYAEGLDISEDYRTFTLHLRKGSKYSDGEPFTSEDFVFFYEDYLKNPEVSPAGPSGWMIVDDEPMEVTAIDDYTVQFGFVAPYRPFENALTNWNSLQGLLFDAKHYLKKWHIDYNPKADQLAKEEGFDTWAQCLISHRNDSFGNGVIGAPCLAPWIPVVWSSSTHAWEANPYYFAVDEEGNQLPYISNITGAMGVDEEVQIAQALAGEIHWLDNQRMNDINMFRDNEEQGDYRTILLNNSLGAQCAIGFNQTIKDPIKRELFQDVRWRQAMSLAINREEINNVVHFGTATPQQHTLSPEVSFYNPEWAEAYAEFDPDRAGELLDELGMEWDAEGQYRLAPDGSEFTLFFDRVDGAWLFPFQEGELIRDYFEEVGIRTQLKHHSRGLLDERREANELDFGAWHSDRIEELRCYIPRATKWNPTSETSWARPWGVWRDTLGAEGEEPIDKYKDHWERMDAWYSATTQEEYERLGKEIWDFFAEDLTVIGTVAFPTAPFILSNQIGNGPKEGMWFGDGMNWYKTFLPATWYFKNL